MLTKPIDNTITNEEIAAEIKRENAAELVPVLYERVRKLLFLKAAQAYNSNRRRFALCGYDFEDLQQECYFVFLKALRGYKPEQPAKFTSYLKYPFKNHFNTLLKCRNGLDTRDAAERDPVRLDAPVSAEDEHETALYELIPDSSLTPHDEQICAAELVQRIRSIVEKLPEPYKEIVKRRFWGKQPFNDIAAEMGLTLSKVTHRCYDVPKMISYKDKLFLSFYSKRLRLWLRFSSSPEHSAAIGATSSVPSYKKRQALIFDAFEKYCTEQQKIVDKST